IVARSFPNTALTSVKRSPVSCMPSPESPANRMTTSSRLSGSSGLVSGVAVTRPSPRCVGSVGKWCAPSSVPTGRAAPRTRVVQPAPSLERLQRRQRLPQGGVDAATVARPADELGLDVDPRSHATGTLVEAPAEAADDDEHVAGLDGLEPRGRVPDGDRDGGD